MRLARLGFLLITICASAAAQQQEPMEVLLSDVERAMEASRYERLEGAQQQGLVFNANSNLPVAKGVAILVADNNTAPLSSTSLAPLAPYLNDSGWHTMILASAYLSVDAETTTQPSEVTVEMPKPFQGKEKLSEQQFNALESQLQQQMQMVLDKAQNYPGFVLVIGQGASAAWLAKLYNDGKLTLPDAFVAVGPYWPQAGLNKQVPELLANTGSPVLDIYNRWDNAWARQTRRQRQIAANLALKLHYRQRELNTELYHSQQFDGLNREIIGWLRYMGW